MVYLIPSLLSENAVESIPPYVIGHVKDCKYIFAENIRTARRYLKKMDPSIVIDKFQWFEIRKDEPALLSDFERCLPDKEPIAIISEAGCPGVADPGQVLVAAAQRAGVRVIPLVGPSSILLALMASGFNGQQFTFHGYLPIEGTERKNEIRRLEEESKRTGYTQIFIETPYRNESLLKDILKWCNPDTLLCIGSEVTSAGEWIHSMAISEWRKKTVPLHKKTAVFLLFRP